MHYITLFKAHQYFSKDSDAYDYDYDFYRKRFEWSNFGTYTAKDIREQAFRFLNKWGCRFTSTDKLASSVKTAYLYHLTAISTLNSEKIQDVDFKSTKNIYTSNLAIGDLIFQIFAGFCNIRSRFRWVVTSKLLHMINPNIFVMWDNGIADGYNLKLNEIDYTYKFLPKMKEEVNEVISTYMQENMCNRPSAIDEIRKQNSQRTPAKLIDEYNFEYTKGRKDL